MASGRRVPSIFPTGEWRNWQTRRIQVPVSERMWGFKSPLAHRLTEASYLVLLGQIHERLLPRTYVEIGVHEGDSLRLARPGTRTVGVDPAPNLREAVDAAVYPMTSDDFFARHDMAEVLAGLPLDLVFIDGMHLFEFVLRDLINVGRNAVPATTVLLHDCYPISAETATRERNTYLWTGDVWKIVLCLKEVCPEVDVHVVDAPPAGLGIVRRLNADTSDRLQERYDELVDRFVNLEYSVLDGHKAELLNRIDYDWSLIEPLLPPSF